MKGRAAAHDPGFRPSGSVMGREASSLPCRMLPVICGSPFVVDSASVDGERQYSNRGLVGVFDHVSIHPSRVMTVEVYHDPSPDFGRRASLGHYVFALSTITSFHSLAPPPFFFLFSFLVDYFSLLLSFFPTL